MKRVALLFFVASAPAFSQLANHVVISEVYAGGGNSGSTWKNDFIELYNPTDSIISIDGWSVQYASATGPTSGPTWASTDLNGAIAPHGFFLIQQAQGTGGTQNLPTPDAIGTLALGAAAGKVALVRNGVALTGTNPTDASIVDKVGYGLAANGFEGSGPTVAPSNTLSIERKASATSTTTTLGSGGTEETAGNGYDSNNNASDFVTRAPQPQNSASPTEPLSNSGDILPPQILLVKALSNTQIEVVFNEPLDSLSSSTANNYSLNKSVAVLQALRDVQNIKRVILSVSAMANDIYSLTVANVADTAQNAMPSPKSFSFSVGILTIAQARAAGAGANVRLKGIVTVGNEFGSPAFIQDSTGGIAVFNTNFALSAKLGEVWEVGGTLKNFNGLLEIDPLTDSLKISSGNPVPKPKLLKSNQLNESVEGQLVRINGVKFIGSGVFGPNTADSSYQSSDAFGPLEIRIDRNSNIPNTPIPADTVNIIGIVNDFNGSYRLMPRGIADVGFVDPPADQTWTDLIIARTYPDSTVVTVRGIVTYAQPGTNAAQKTVYFQDRTAGLAIFDPTTDTLLVGDSIHVRGKLVQFHNLQELKLVDSLVLLARSVPVPPAKPLPIPQASETYESQLVNVSAVQFVETGTFAGNTTYHVSDGTVQLDLRVGNNSALVGANVPLGVLDITGVLGQFDARYQLIARTTADFEAQPGPVISALPVITALTDVSFTVSFNTILSGNTVVQFGKTPALGDSLVDNTQTTTHTATISGLTAGRVYYSRVATSNDLGTSASPIIPVVTTSSASTGQMQVYFNYSVDNTLGLLPAANGNTNLGTKLLERISAATKSIDLALYSFDDFSGSATDIAQRVADSLIAAKNRSVKVRMVFENRANTGPVNSLINSGVSVIKRPGSVPGLMHNKFLVFDGRDTTSATDDWVIAGSWNVTDGGTYLDAQNAIFIQDQSLARIYTIEFEELFGSQTETANSGAAKFGPQKADNTPHWTWVNGTKVEVFFSPSDRTTQQIVRAISTANQNIFFGLFSFTRDDIAAAIISRKNAGVIVRGMIDNTGDAGVELGNLQAAGVDARAAGHSVVTGDFHHKYGVVDPFNDASDPIVVTGSHNWSSAAENDNDENTFIIHSGPVARQFTQEFAKRYKESGGVNPILSVEAIEGMLPLEYTLSQNYPNPFNPTTHFEFRIANRGMVKLSVFDVLGREVAPLVNEEKPAGTYRVAFDASRLSSGIYLYKLEAGSFTASRKMLLLK